MIKNVYCTELRQIIADILKPTIEMYRLSNENQFFSEFDLEPTEDEVDDFIAWIPYLDDLAKNFLLSDAGGVTVAEEWLEIFKENTSTWYEEYLIRLNSI